MRDVQIHKANLYNKDIKPLSQIEKKNDRL